MTKPKGYQSSSAETKFSITFVLLNEEAILKDAIISQLLHNNVLASLLLLPISENVIFTCFHIIISFRYGEAPSFLLLVYTISIPIHPGIETA